MEEAAAVREAATDAVGDVDPERLREEITGVIGDGSMAPGVLTLLSARSGNGGDVPDGVDDLAAGVQLIYDGLRLTRDLSHSTPWSQGEAERGDIAIVAADVLVARGFYLLARTSAADEAVEVVRSFGHDQTRRRGAEDPAALDANLERDVLELAVVTGLTAIGGSAPDDLSDRVAATIPEDVAFPSMTALADDADALVDGAATDTANPEATDGGQASGSPAPGDG